jgi:periplasmic divalent cation tolerance protein
MISHYWWQGKLERGEETVMIYKTRASLVEDLRRAVKESHPYTVPAFVVLPLEGGDPAYLDWIVDEATGEPE